MYGCRIWLLRVIYIGIYRQVIERERERERGVIACEDRGRRSHVCGSQRWFWLSLPATHHATCERHCVRLVTIYTCEATSSQ